MKECVNNLIEWYNYQENKSDKKMVLYYSTLNMIGLDYHLYKNLNKEFPNPDEVKILWYNLLIDKKISANEIHENWVINKNRTKAREWLYNKSNCKVALYLMNDMDR